MKSKVVFFVAALILPMIVIGGGSYVLARDYGSLSHVFGYRAAPAKARQAKSGRVNAVRPANLGLLAEASTVEFVLKASPAARAEQQSRSPRAQNEVTATSMKLRAEQVLAQLKDRFIANLDRLGGNLLRFDNVFVLNSYRVSKQQIDSAVAQPGSWIWSQSLGDIKQRIEEIPWIERTNVDLSVYPLRLTVALTEAEPWLVAEYQGISWLVSSKGALIQPLRTITDSTLIIDASELPRLDGLDAQEGVESFLSSDNARFAYAVKLIKFYEMAGGFPFKVERITLLKNGALRLTAEDSAAYPSVVINANNLEDARHSLERLDLVMNDLKRRGEKTNRIDLCFSNRAVVQ
jgi:hypothetical protein